ncbi:hypothetical protein L916_04347, partial [Phytophthora nicotianae]
HAAVSRPQCSQTTVHEHSPGSENEAKARRFRSESGCSVGGHTPVSSKHSVNSLHSLASDHVDHDSKRPERSESPADEAKGSSNAGGDEGVKPPKNLSLAEGLERVRAAKAAATEAKHSKKRMASRSPLREGKETDAYYTMFDSSDEEEEAGIVPSCPAKAWAGAYERALVQKEPLFADDVEAARCVLLAQHQILLKDFTACRKKPENRGCLYPVWGYPWVLPENCPSLSSCEDMFWAWVETLKYSPTELQELREDRLLSKILNQRDLRIRFVHLVSKRQLPRDIQKRAASSDHDERGYGVSSMSVPRSGKKPRTTYEAAAASVPRSRQSSGSQPEAVQSAFISSRSGHNPFTSQGAGTYRKAAAPGVPAPRGSGPLCSGRGGAEVPSYE